MSWKKVTLFRYLKKVCVNLVSFFLKCLYMQLSFQWSSFLFIDFCLHLVILSFYVNDFLNNVCNIGLPVMNTYVYLKKSLYCSPLGTILILQLGIEFQFIFHYFKIKICSTVSSFKFFLVRNWLINCYLNLCLSVPNYIWMFTIFKFSLASRNLKIMCQYNIL